MIANIEPAKTAARRSGSLAETARSIRVAHISALALALVVLSAFWIKQSEITSVACLGSGAVPATPALAILLLALAINPLLRRTGIVRPLSVAEQVLLYTLVTVGVMMYGIGGMRHLMAAMTEHVYLSTSAEPTVRLAPFIPSWLAPESPRTIRWMYEGSPHGLVPWAEWWAPVAAWTLFFLLLGGAILGLLLVVSDRWLFEERLTFPLARMPLELLGAGTIGAFFRNPLAWVGMIIATLLNAHNMIRGVFMGGPNYGEPVFWVNSIQLSYPWAALHHIPLITIAFKPSLVGLGYLVSNDVSGSIISFYLVTKVVGILMASLGSRDAEAPFAREQSAGGYIALALVLLWARRDALRRAFAGAGEAGPAGEGLAAARWGALVSVACFVGLMVFLYAAGMALWLAALSMAILILVSISYARVRAETGVPLNWVRPYTLEYTMIWSILGGGAVARSGRSLASPTIFAMTGFLSRTGFTSGSGTQIEGIMLCRNASITYRQIAVGIMLAIGVGILGGFALHLTSFYSSGALMLPGGHWGMSFMRGWYADVLHNWDAPRPVHLPKTIATLVGAAITIGICLTRSKLGSLPLHPVGFLVANTEYACWLFPSFVITYTCKSLVLRYGGSGLYRRLLPLFLGLAVGHFVSGGVIWGTLSAALGGPFMRWSAWVN